MEHDLQLCNLIKLQVVYFVNSGSEANELAMLMARLYTGNLGMISLRNAYHGGTYGTLGLTALHMWKYPIPEVSTIAYFSFCFSFLFDYDLMLFILNFIHCIN